MAAKLLKAANKAGSKSAIVKAASKLVKRKARARAVGPERNKTSALHQAKTEARKAAAGGTGGAALAEKTAGDAASPQRASSLEVALQNEADGDVHNATMCDARDKREADGEGTVPAKKKRPGNDGKALPAAPNHLEHALVQDPRDLGKSPLLGMAPWQEEQDHVAFIGSETKGSFDGSIVLDSEFYPEEDIDDIPIETPRNELGSFDGTFEH